MTQPNDTATAQNGDTAPPAGPTYADAIERASAALMFREPTLARTSKTARAIAERIVDALVAAQITRPTIVNPAVAQQLSMDETN